MLKNLKPKKVALLLAIIFSAIFFFGSFLMRTFENSDQPIFLQVLILFCVFILGYYLVLFFLRIFIYQRIRIVYKNIHKFKAENEAKNNQVLYNDNALDQVEADVGKWVDEQEAELKSLKSLETYRRQFIGNISHELKTPIFNIQGYVHTLLDGGIFDENINIEYLRKAAQNTERLQIIIEDLDAIARLDSGELVLEMEKFNIKELVQNVYDELDLISKQNKAKLRFRDNNQKGFLVKADKRNIRQVLVNLITNAMKYGNEDGEVTASFYDMDTYILVEIADNGIGIEEKHLSHLFDRFYRVDRHRSRAVGGSGLGLAIVKHVIEAHKQKIHVRSTLNVGSTFSFTLAKS